MQQLNVIAKMPNKEVEPYDLKSNDFGRNETAHYNSQKTGIDKDFSKVIEKQIVKDSLEEKERAVHKENKESKLDKISNSDNKACRCSGKEKSKEASSQADFDSSKVDKISENENKKTTNASEAEIAVSGKVRANDNEIVASEALQKENEAIEKQSEQLIMLLENANKALVKNDSQMKGSQLQTLERIGIENKKVQVLNELHAKGEIESGDEGNFDETKPVNIVTSSTGIDKTNQEMELSDKKAALSEAKSVYAEKQSTLVNLEEQEKLASKKETLVQPLVSKRFVEEELINKSLLQDMGSSELTGGKEASSTSSTSSIALDNRLVNLKSNEQNSQYLNEKYIKENDSLNAPTALPKNEQSTPKLAQGNHNVTEAHKSQLQETDTPILGEKNINLEIENKALKSNEQLALAINKGNTEEIKAQSIMNSEKLAVNLGALNPAVNPLQLLAEQAEKSISQSALNKEKSHAISEKAIENHFVNLPNGANEISLTQSKSGQVHQETISIFRHDFAQAVKDKVMVVISQKLQRFEISLDPPELGNVQVRVNLQGEQATVNFTVSNAQTKDALEASMNKLKDMLAQEGVDLGDTNVEQGDEQAQQSHQETFNTGVMQNKLMNNEDAEQLTLSTRAFNQEINGIDYYA